MRIDRDLYKQQCEAALVAIVTIDKALSLTPDFGPLPRMVSGVGIYEACEWVTASQTQCLRRILGNSFEAPYVSDFHYNHLHCDVATRNLQPANGAHWPLIDPDFPS